jgi:hypothetical protein
MVDRLGLVAGGGVLPRRVVERCRADGRGVFVVALKGQADPATVADVPHTWIALGAPGRGLRALRAHGCRELVLAGPVRRPAVTELRLDVTAMRFFARLGRRALGDDGLLRAVIGALETEGFRVRGVHDVLGDVLAPLGVLGAVAPDDGARADIDRGCTVADALGRADVGQAVIVQQGLVLGVEAIEGTDALIRRCAALHRAGPGGVLVKLPKPAQDRRADLPAIGPGTVAAAAESGVRGIAVAADATLVVDPDATIAAADRRGLFLQGIHRQP